MFLRKANSNWIVRTPAKLNVYLSIQGRRADGYHELQTLMVPIRLFDDLTLSACSPADSKAKGRFRLICPNRTKGSAGTPADETNLVVRAIDALRRKTGRPLTAEITLTKRIPAGAGLGGGSSDAAAALVAANAAWRLGLAHDELAEVAASLGSDVPFFVAGKPAVCSGRGEVVTPLKANTRLHVIVVTPQERLASAAVYAALLEGDFADAPSTGSSWLQQVVHAFQRGDVGGLGRRMVNGLARAALSLEPNLSRLRDALTQFGTGAGMMSGSGSSFFCLCRTAREARRGAAHLRSLGYSSAIATTSYC